MDPSIGSRYGWGAVGYTVGWDGVPIRSVVELEVVTTPFDNESSLLDDITKVSDLAERV